MTLIEFKSTLKVQIQKSVNFNISLKNDKNEIFKVIKHVAR